MYPNISIAPEAHITRLDQWTIHSFEELSSTNSEAASYPAWHAIRANTQTAGRGRMGHSWVSDVGGLWLSMVLPTPGKSERWEILPLAAGWAVLTTLRSLGLPDLRLRWPNDIMTGNRKLAGILVEKYHSETAVIGVGINIFNRPSQSDETLEGKTARLGDVLSGDYSIDQVTHLLLCVFADLQATLESGRFNSLWREINREWNHDIPVELTITKTGRRVRGFFHGIDHAGRVLIDQFEEGRQIYDASQISMLREAV